MSGSAQCKWLAWQKFFSEDLKRLMRSGSLACIRKLVVRQLIFSRPSLHAAFYFCKEVHGRIVSEFFNFFL